jgi:recombinational DNA repair ATPase RecF
LPSEDCPLCARLWKEFATATNSYLRILGEQQMAVIQQDSAVLASLNQALAEAGARRQQARNEFRVHAATHERLEPRTEATDPH